MRLLELRPSTVKEIISMSKDFKTPSDFVRYLQSIRYEYLDHGYFGRVFLHSASNFVIKVSTRPDVGYIKFAKYAINNQKDPHMPKLKLVEFKSKYEDSFFVSFIEKLEGFDDWGGDKYFMLSKAMTVFSKIANGMITLDEQLRILKQHDFYNEFVKILRENKSLFFSMNKLRKEIPGVIYDMLLRNFMKRKDGTIVIIDPVSPDIN